MDTPLDLNNPPKYCPACAANGLKKKVKRYIDDGKEDYMCMNGDCPWPFNLRKVKKKKKKHKRSRDDSEEPGPSMPPISPEHKKQKLSENNEAGPSGLQSSSVGNDNTVELPRQPQPPSPPSTSTDIEVAGFMTPVEPVSLHADLALSCTPRPTDTASSDKSDDKESDLKIDSTVSFLGSLPTRQQEMSPAPAADVSTPKPLPRTLSSSQVPDEASKALAPSGCSPVIKLDSAASSKILAQCSPGHILDTSSPSYNIPSPGSAFNLVSPKHRRMSMEDGRSPRLIEDAKSPHSDIELKSRETSKRRLSNNGDSMKKAKKATALTEPLTLDDDLLDYEPEGVISVESQSEEDSPKKPTAQTSNKSEIQVTDTSSLPGPSGTQPGVTSQDSDPNFTVMPTKIRPPLRLPKHASQMLSSRSSREPSPDMQPPEVFEGFDEGNESEEDIMADADDSDSELESLASECSTMSTISDAGSVDSLNGFGKKKRRGKKKKRKDRRKVHQLKCTKTTGVRPSDLSFKDLAQLENLGTEVEKLEPFSESSNRLKSDDIKSPNNETAKLQREQAISTQDNTTDEEMSVQPQVVEKPELMETETVSTVKVSPDYPMQSSEKEDLDAMESSRVDISPEIGNASPDYMDNENSIKLFGKGGSVPSPLSPMSTDDQSDDTLRISNKKGSTRGKKNILLPKFRTPVDTVKRVGLKVMLPVGREESVKHYDVKSDEDKREGCFVTEDNDLANKAESSKTKSVETSEVLAHTEDQDAEELSFESEIQKGKPLVSKEKDVFKSPKPANHSTAPNAHVFLSPAHSMPSPHYSSLPSPSHSVPSPGHFSTPSLLSPMPPTPKSDNDEDTVALPLKLLLKRNSHKENSDWTSSSNSADKSTGSDQGKISGKSRKGNLDKVVLNLQKSVGGQWQKTLPKDDMESESESESKLNEEPIPPMAIKTSRRGRKSKEIKNFDELQKPEVIQNAENEKENESGITLPYNNNDENLSSIKAPPKRGRPPKNKDSYIPSQAKPPSSSSVSPSECHKQVVAADGKRRIKLTPCNPPQSLFAISPARSPRFPPPLSPASLPPSPIVSGGGGVASLKSVRPIKASTDEEKTSSRPCSSSTKSTKGKNDDDNDELLANVEKALAVQNAKNNLNADSSFDTSQDKSDDSSSSQDKKEPIRTFSRPKKQVVKEGVAHPTISNWLSMTAGIGIEAKLVDDNTIHIPPQLDWMSKPAADPEDATVTKVGAGLSSDYAFLNQFMYTIDKEDHKKGDVILHVSRGDKSSISLPRQEDRTQVKQHNDTQIDLTADSDEIDVHSLRLVSADIAAFPGASARSRGKNKASSQPDVVQQEAVQVAHNLIKANNPEHRTTTYGDDWFQWEDWRIDAKFMEIFYEQINRMMQHDMSTKVKTPIIPGLNPIIQMLYSKKRDKSYSKLDIDKMIRFFTTVGVKYWYAVNTCKISQKDAIDTLKRDPYKSNPDYITFLKERKIQELRGNSQTNTSEPPEVGQLLSRQQSLNEPGQLKQVLASQQPVPPCKLKGPLKSSAPPEVIQMARGGSGPNPPLAHQSGHTTLIQLTRTPEVDSSNAPPKAHSGGLLPSPKGELTITKKTTVQVAPGLVPPASPAGPINLSRKYFDEKGIKKVMHSQARPIQSFASPVRMYASTGSPAQPIYHELQVVRDGGKDGRAIIARQAATGLKSPAVAASPRYMVSSSPRYENPLTPSVDSPAPLSVQTSNPPSVQPMSIKQEADQIQQTPVNPDSVAVTSYLDNSVCSVQMIPSVNPDVRNSKGRIGNGNKCVQFFYEKGMTDSPAFPPVYVNTVDEVRAVAAFVAEKAGDFKRRGGGDRGVIPQYYTEAAKARYILDKHVIKHIEKCFTKKGMKDFKIGAKKRNYPKRSTIIKIGPEGRSDDHPGDSVIKVERIDNEESETAEDLEYRSMGPPNDANHMQEIESIVFGNRMPKAKPRKFNSEKTTTGDTGKGSKRGGKNKLDYKNPSSPMMMGVVSDLLQRSKSIEIQRTDHDVERIQEEAVDDVEAEDESEMNANKPLKVSTSFLRKKRSIGSAVQSKVKNKSKSAKTDSDGEEMDNILSGSGDSVRDSPIDAEKDPDQFSISKETAKNKGDNVDREKYTENVQNENANNVKDGASDNTSIIVESTSCVTKPSGEDSMSERERLQQNCMIGGNMVAVAPEVLAEVNDSKEGLDKIVETVTSKVSNEVQGVRKSYRKKHPNKTWKESNEDVFNEKEKEVAEMVRSVSRGSRPSSQASLPDSRPSSQASLPDSRPSSQNDASPSRRPSQARRLFGELIGHTEEPHPDSPVLGTRHRRTKEDAVKAIAAAEANKHELQLAKPTTTNEPQVQFNIKAPKFETSFVRESKVNKVKYLLQKKEKKDKKKSKYRGFGETSDPPKVEQPKVVKVKKVKKTKVEDPVSEVVKRKNEKLTTEEKNLMEELMNCASLDVPSSSGSLNPKSQTKEISKNIAEFEEQQTLSNDNAIREDFLEFI